MAVNAPHAFAASAGDCLDQDRVADLVGFLLEKFWLLHLPVITGDNRNPGLLHDGLGAVFQTHSADGVGGRTDKRYAGLKAGLGKFGIFRKEAVAGMNTVSMRRLGACDELFDRQIALCGRGRTDGMGLITDAHVERVPVRVRIDRDAAQAQAPRGSGNAARNLTAIGDQDGFEHEGPRYVGRRY